MNSRRHKLVPAAAIALLAFLLPGARTGAQCEFQWLAGPHQGIPGTDGVVRAMTHWDPDGDGPLPEWLVIAGTFTIAGDTAATNIVAWDGQSFHRLGDGIPGTLDDFGVRALTVYRGELIAGGAIFEVAHQPASGVVAWDGANWRPLGTSGQPGHFNGYVDALTVHEAELIAGGRFNRIDGLSAANVASWDGASWHALGSGLDGEVNALTVYDGQIIAGGLFTRVGNPSWYNTARWDGQTWSQMNGSSSLGQVYSFIEHQGTLFAGAAVGVRQWTETGWQHTGHNRIAHAMLVYDGRLIASGSDLMVLEQGTWQRFAFASGPIFPALALATLNGDLIVGGSFTHARGVIARSLVRYSATDDNWLSFGSGFDGYLVRAATWAGDLVVTGPFQSVAGADARNVARWDGHEWHAFGNAQPMMSVYAIAEHAGELYIGGVRDRYDQNQARRLARWHNGAWVTIVDAPGGHIAALLSVGDELIVAGELTSADGLPVANIARLDAAGAWGPMGEGFNDEVTALIQYDGALFAAGEFTASGATPLNNIARWDGVAWQPVGDFPGGSIRSLVVHNGELIVGGRLNAETTALAAAWDGTTWRIMPGGTGDETLVALASFENRLISARSRTPYGPLPGQVISEWNGAEWVYLADQPNDLVSDLIVHNDELIAVGRFTRVEDLGSAYWARYALRPSPTCPADLNCDATVDAVDLLAYLDDWFSHEFEAERTGDTPPVIDVFDLLVYLDAWFAGC